MSSWVITFFELDTALEETSRSDDGIDYSVVSNHLAKATIAKGIERIRALDYVAVKLPLASDGKAQTLTFSPEWKVAHTPFYFVAVPLASLSISFKVADDQLICGNLLVEQPVLHRFENHSRTFL